MSSPICAASPRLAGRTSKFSSTSFFQSMPEKLSACSSVVQQFLDQTCVSAIPQHGVKQLAAHLTLYADGQVAREWEERGLEFICLLTAFSPDEPLWLIACRQSMSCQQHCRDKVHL